MSLEEERLAEASALSRHRIVVARPRRPWSLIAAALLLAVLSLVLWIKWRDSRTRADQLQAELQQAYAEAESLRTQAVRAQQRVSQLERDLRTLAAGDSGAKLPPSVSAKKPHPR